jgi:quinol monooxygenase YgiN
MSKHLIFVAKIEAKPDKFEFVKSELQKLVSPTLKEPGCIQYDLHQDIENPALFLLYESWESRELWQQHTRNPRLGEFMKTTEGAVVSFTINEMTRL